MHDGVVQLGIEGLAHLAEGLDAQAFHDGDQAVHGHFHALLVGLVGGFLIQGPLQVVEHRQELAHGLGLDVGVEIVALLLAALAEIVVLGGQPQVAVMLGGQLGFQLFHGIRLGRLLLGGFVRRRGLGRFRSGGLGLRGRLGGFFRRFRLVCMLGFFHL